MFIEIFLAVFLGILSGIFTGLIPGIHVNLISLLVLSFSPFLSAFASLPALSVYIISLAITHSFLDSIPSIYLGAPDEAQALSVLPGHKLLHKGEGHNAIACTVIGSYSCLIFCLCIFPFFLWAMQVIAPLVEKIVGYLLLLIVTFMVLREKEKLLAFSFFIMSGVLGILVFSIESLQQPLFPLLSGLFGFSIMILSLSQKATIPKQDFTKKLQLEKKSVFRSMGAASFVGFIAAFLPGFGNSQAAIVANEIVKEASDEAFLVLVGGINTANMLISIGTVYALEKARNGAIVAIRELVEIVDFKMMLLFLFTALFVGSCAGILTLKISKIFSKHIGKMNYVKIILSIIIFITILTFIFDKLIGLIILFTATCVGLSASLLGIAKNHLMGTLILPVALYFIL